jgi:hypothetical protein
MDQLPALQLELCKRNYQVALTMGNHPMVDIMVISPGGIQFSVDVKGQYRRKAASVLPDPVGAATRTCSQARIAGHASACAAVGASNRRSNQAATAG